MIEFEWGRWKNLLSYGNVWARIDFNKHRTTLIHAKNGSGKSTVLDFLSFVLYGKAFRNINKDQLINSINKKGLICELQFKIGKNSYLIKRGINPDIFEIYENDVLKPIPSKILDYQDTLENQILKMNYKTFTQIVILGSVDYVQFMKLEKGSRKIVIEDILTIKVFTAMDSILKTKVTENKQSISDIKQAIELLNQKLLTETKLLEQLQQNHKELIQEKTSKIEEYSKEIEEHLEKISKKDSELEILSKQISSESKLRKQFEKLKVYYRQLSDKKIDTEKQIKFYETENNCPTCKQLIQEDFKEEIKKKKQNKIQEINEALQDLIKQKQHFSDVLETFSKVESEIVSINKQILELNQNIKIKNDLISSFQKEINEHNKVKANKTSNNNEINQLKLEIISKKDELESLLKDKKIMEISSTILKDGGIKTRIIKQYVPVINSLINKYLSLLEFYVNFEFDENFKETLKSRFRDKFSYASFSNGEKVRIDLAILLTWRALTKMRNNMSCNLLILDEIFDNSVDLEAVEEFLKLLKNSDEKTNTFVISPKGDVLADKFDNVIKVEKKKNFSRLIN